MPHRLRLRTPRVPATTRWPARCGRISAGDTRVAPSNTRSEGKRPETASRLPPPARGSTVSRELGCRIPGRLTALLDVLPPPAHADALERASQSNARVLKGLPPTRQHTHSLHGGPPHPHSAHGPPPSGRRGFTRRHRRRLHAFTRGCMTYAQSGRRRP